MWAVWSIVSLFAEISISSNCSFFTRKSSRHKHVQARKASSPTSSGHRAKRKRGIKIGVSTSKFESKLKSKFKMLRAKRSSNTEKAADDEEEHTEFEKVDAVRRPARQRGHKFQLKWKKAEQLESDNQDSRITETTNTEFSTKSSAAKSSSQKKHDNSIHSTKSSHSSKLNVELNDFNDSECMRRKPKKSTSFSSKKQSHSHSDSNKHKSRKGRFHRVKVKSRKRKRKTHRRNQRKSKHKKHGQNKYHSPHATPQESATDTQTVRVSQSEEKLTERKYERKVSPARKVSSPKSKKLRTSSKEEKDGKNVDDKGPDISEWIDSWVEEEKDMDDQENEISEYDRTMRSANDLSTLTPPSTRTLCTDTGDTVWISNEALAELFSPSTALNRSISATSVETELELQRTQEDDSEDENLSTIKDSEFSSSDIGLDVEDEGTGEAVTDEYVVISDDACKVLQIIKDEDLFYDTISSSDCDLLKLFFAEKISMDERVSHAIFQALEQAIDKVRKKELDKAMKEFLSNKYEACNLLLEALKAKKEEYVPSYWQLTDEGKTTTEDDRSVPRSTTSEMSTDKDTVTDREQKVNLKTKDMKDVDSKKETSNEADTVTTDRNITTDEESQHQLGEKKSRGQ
ncbi:hypothetical protein AB6A40_006841 [Gnathostoma spinigerum]|uniref:Uncharacterized protein n=1 Tax=Gnathostoma spinigerum TaxID=75299 RepID=A0ABD6ETW8_9BILA